METKPTSPELQLESIPDEALEIFKDRWGLDKETCLRSGIRWCGSMGKGRAAFPIRSNWGMRTGWSLRSLCGELPKARIVLTTTDSAPISYYAKGSVGARNIAVAAAEKLLLVEDPVSAIKASEFITTAALLGTDLSDSKIATMQAIRPKEVIVALDEDAKEKGMAMARKLSGLISKVTWLPLKKDIKDMNREDIQRMLSE